MIGNLLYTTKYGSTESVCNWICEGITRYGVTIQKMSENVSLSGDFFIIGTPIFIGKPTQDFIRFITAHKSVLCKNPLFLFITSWAESTEYKDACQGFLDLLSGYLHPCVPVHMVSLPGKLLWNTLSSRDRQVMTRLLRRIDVRQPSFCSDKITWSDQRDATLCRAFGTKINCWLETYERGYTKRKEK